MAGLSMSLINALESVRHTTPRGLAPHPARNCDDISAKWANQRNVYKREYENKWREKELRAAVS